jgi:hypothetical protein
MLWEILVPTKMHPLGADGNVDYDKPSVFIHAPYHRKWDEYVMGITGLRGITIMRPADGKWEAPDGKFFEEKMIPVRFVCKDELVVKNIIDFTVEHYRQQSVMAYLISDRIRITSVRKANETT